MHILPCSWSGCIVMMMKSPTLLRPSFRAACFQTRAISSKKDPVAPPRALLDALSEGWFRVIQVPGQGRGLFAARLIPQGTDVLRERPLLCAPSPTLAQEVCWHCLAVLPATPTIHPRGRRHFCSSACLHAAESSYHTAEASAPAADLQAFHAHCAKQGERFPWLSARLAFMQLQSLVMPQKTAAHPDAHVVPDASSKPASTEQQRPANEPLQGDAVHDMSLLCFARTSPPYPPPWQDSYAALRPALAQVTEHLANAAAPSADAASSTGQGLVPPQGNPGGEFDVGQGVKKPTANDLMQQISIDWWADALSRISINAFRIDTIVMPRYGYGAGTGFQTLTQLAAAAILAEEGGSSTTRSVGEEEGPAQGRGLTGHAQPSRMFASGFEGGAGERSGTGSAVYLVASLVNHSCVPNLDVVFPRNDSTLALRAARDIEPGEQLVISYVDQDLPLSARQQLLSTGYGFMCKCQKCKEELSSQSA